MMGSSMGGLITFYGGIRHQSVFSKIGIFSPSYWFSNQVWTYPATVGPQHPMRIYQLAGGLEGSGSVAQQIGQMKQTLIAAGFDEQQIQNKVVPNGQHTEAFWRQEFGDAILWLFADHYFISTGEDYKTKSFSIYPNPFKDTLYIFSTQRNLYQVLLTDLTGRLYYSGQLTSDELQRGLNLSFLKEGAYVLRVTNGTSWNISKILIRN